MDTGVVWVPIPIDSPFGKECGLTEEVLMPFFFVNESPYGSGMKAPLTPQGLVKGVLIEYASAIAEPPFDFALRGLDWEETQKIIPDALQSLRKGFGIPDIATMLIDFCFHIAEESELDTSVAAYESALLLCPEDHRIRSDYIMTIYGQWQVEPKSITETNWRRVLTLMEDLDLNQLNPGVVPALKFMCARACEALRSY